MPNQELTTTEAAILKWVRENTRRIENHESAECAILLLGRPDNAEMIIHELEDHCAGFTTVGGETIASGDDVHVWSSLVE